AATVSIPAKSFDPGAYAVSLAYHGNATYAEATGTATVTVTKAAATIFKQVIGAPITVNSTGRQLEVTVAATNVTPTGTVTVLVNSQTLTGTLTDRKVTFDLPPFSSPGQVPVMIQYG